MQGIHDSKTTVSLSDFRLNERNPRTIRKEAFSKLCASVKAFPKMMAVRGIVVDADGIVIGGTQRYRACVANGMTEVPSEWIKRADDFTPEERRRFIIADNAPDGLQGEWDMDLLANEWDMDELLAAGFDESLFGLDEAEESKPAETPPDPPKEKEKPTLADMAEDNSKLAKFIAAREASRARGADKGEVNFWVCLVFQSWDQKQEFLKQVPDVPTRYGMYADGEAFATACGKPVTPNTQKPIKVPLDATLSEMAT